MNWNYVKRFKLYYFVKLLRILYTASIFDYVCEMNPLTVISAIIRLLAKCGIVWSIIGHHCSKIILCHYLEHCYVQVSKVMLDLTYLKYSKISAITPFKIIERPYVTFYY